MKKLRYSALLKTSAFLLQQGCIVILVLSAVLVSSLFNRSIFNISDIKSKPFKESGYFEELFKTSVEDVLRFTSYREKFETDGEYDPGKIVNISEYMNSGALSSPMGIETDDFQATYYLEDIYHWSKGNYRLIDGVIDSSFYISENGNMFQRQTITSDGIVVMDEEISVESISDLSVSLQEEIIERVEHYYGGNYDAITGQYQNFSNSETVPNEVVYDGSASSDESTTQSASAATADSDEEEAVNEENAEEILLNEAISKAKDGELYKLKGRRLSLLLRDLDFTSFRTSMSDSFVQEDYLPVGSNSSIMDLFLNNTIDLEELQRLYDALEYSLTTIGEEVGFYKKSLNSFDKNETNLNYWIVESAKQVRYTNIKDTESAGMPLLEYGEKKGSYFYYNELENRLVTSITGLEDDFYNEYESIYQGKKRVIFITIDTTFPVKDKFFEAKKDYNSLHPWVSVSVFASIICFLGYILCFIYLSMSTGIRDGNEEPCLCWFDKIKTELMLVGFTISCVVVVVSFGEISTQLGTEDLTGILVTSGILAFIGNLLVMFFYLSFVRRVKASTMWRDSIVCWLITGMQGLMKNRKSTTKVAILITAQILILSFLLISQVDDAVYIALGLLFIFEFIILIREGIQRNRLMDGIKKISDGDLEYKIDTLELKGDNRIFGEAINTIGEGLYRAIDDSMKNERLKADLITNVSHDIKTPLTSIINYVALIKREDINNDRVQNYIEVLDNKSQRLKQLTEDLVEASKVASGNVTLQMERINFVELIHQVGGECAEKFEERNLTTIMKMPREPVVILADGRQIWRVIENLYNNVAKYAMSNTRVYVDMSVIDGEAVYSMKNISAQPLNINADELTERFIRGDVSRSTEGSGLGLSIAKSLSELMNGSFDIYLDGDLFKATVSFPIAEEETVEIEQLEEAKK